MLVFNHKEFFWKRTILMLLIAFLLIPAGQAQRRVSGTNIHYEEGDWISYSNTRYVNSLAIGTQYVYFATTGGITRYDIFQSRWNFPFTTSNGLPSNNILTVAFDVGTSHLWCATTEAVCYYNPGSRRWRTLYYDELGMSGGPVTSIGFSEHQIWLVTAEGQTFVASKSDMEFIKETLRTSEDNKDSIIWFGEKGFVPLTLPQFFLPDGIIFFPGPDRTYLQDFKLRQFDFSYYAVDPWQTLWFGTRGWGAGNANMRTQNMKLLPFGLIGQDVHALASDGSGLWIGGVQHSDPIKGITYWDQKHNTWKYFEARYLTRMRSDDVTSIAPDGRYVWFGTLDGLVCYTRSKNQWYSYTVFDGLSDNYIYDVIVDSQSVWIATEDGLDRIDKHSVDKGAPIIEHITNPADKVTVFDIELDRQQLWAGTNYGIYFYDTVKRIGGYYRGPNGPGARIVTAVSANNDQVWFGTLTGVEVYDRVHRVWKGPPERRFATNLPVITIKATDKAVWVGTEQAVYKYDKQRRTWRLFTTEDGLLDNTVQAILPAGDYVWFGTPKGLTRFYWNAPYRID